MLVVLDQWGECACRYPFPACFAPSGSVPLPFDEELARHDLTTQQWDEFEQIMQTGTQAQQDNYLCWMLHYLERHQAGIGCNGEPPGCPDTDPFGGH